MPIHPLLATKLHPPRPLAHMMRRAHLIERLQRGTARALTLVSAPAGFGKTTLLAQWVAQSDLLVAWLSLEAEENDPTRFLFYLIAALQTLDAQMGSTALSLLGTPQPPPPEEVLAVLISDVISRDTGDFALVLDDYHVITAESIQRGMVFLLDHLPSQMHLVLASRADPPLSLARLRARGQLTKERTADLRFGTAEAGTFLQEVMGLDLEASDIATLQNRTEGWIAGQQLAALSLQGRTDSARFLATFSGSHRYVLDYLTEEVLSRQPEAVQHALAIPDFELAACLIEPIAIPGAAEGQISTVLGWLNALPEALMRTRPLLCAYHATWLMFTNQFEAAEARVQDAEQGIREEKPAERVRTLLHLHARHLCCYRKRRASSVLVSWSSPPMTIW